MKDLSKTLNIIAIILAASLISACGGGGSNSSGTQDNNPGGSDKNVAPTIAGSPATSITTQANYSFTPSVSDPEGDTLTFTVENLPSWANFNTNTGTISGVPTASGSFSNITITVSDGTNTVSLAPFTIAVTVTSSGSGNASISWSIPGTYEDGSTLNTFDIGGYKVYQGTSPGNLTEVADINSATTTNFTVNNLSSNTYYFSISVYDSDGIESGKSAPISITI